MFAEVSNIKELTLYERYVLNVFAKKAYNKKLGFWMDELNKKLIEKEEDND